MKLNTKLGICKPKEVEPVRTDPSLENKITALLDILSKTPSRGEEYLLDIRRDGSGLIKEARENGHDGVIIYNVKDDYNNDKKTRSTTTLTVFSSNQIKSATGNRGTFDPADARIQYQAGPPIDPFDTAGDWATQELELEEGTATAGEVVQALKARAAELQKLVECLK